MPLPYHGYTPPVPLATRAQNLRKIVADCIGDDAAVTLAGQLVTQGFSGEDFIREYSAIANQCIAGVIAIPFEALERLEINQYA